jgi:hypothetical protein
MKNYITWLKITAISQIIIAIFHSISLFVSLPPSNETEKQLFTLIDTYKLDLGAGFHRTMNELTLVFSACFCLLYLLGGLLNWYLLRKKVEPRIMKGVITINLVIFGICFVLATIFAFLIPIILTGLVLPFLILSRFTIPKNS